MLSTSHATGVSIDTDFRETYPVYLRLDGVVICLEITNVNIDSQFHSHRGELFLKSINIPQHPMT